MASQGVGVQRCFTLTPLDTLRRLPASAAESLMHICRFPSRCALLCIYSPVKKPFTPFIFTLCCCRLFMSDFVPLSVFVVPPSLPAADLSSSLPPASWHVGGSVGRATLILHSRFSSKTGKSARVCLCVCVCFCRFKCAHFTPLFCFANSAVRCNLLRKCCMSICRTVCVSL